jgi:hypothetical protein
MLRCHMLRIDNRIPQDPFLPEMAGNTASVEKHFHHNACQANVDLLSNDIEGTEYLFRPSLTR